jgi:hypothetical protein
LPDFSKVGKITDLWRHRKQWTGMDTKLPYIYHSLP